MIRRLPIYRGYTVDARLREFRRMPADGLPEFVSYDSKQGRRLVLQMIAEGLADWATGAHRDDGRDGPVDLHLRQHRQGRRLCPLST